MVDELLDLLELDERLRFTLDGQLTPVDDYLEIRPGAEPRIRRLVEEGRLAIGPWQTLMDEFLVSGEAIVRNLETGLARAEELGGAMRVGYLPDMFGHFAQMPQILRRAGIETAVVWRGVPAEIDRHAFSWQGPCGRPGPRLDPVGLDGTGARSARAPRDVIRVANAPVSYGAFELTVGIVPNVPGPVEVLAAMAAAGYEGTELGPPGYLGDTATLRERLETPGLELAGGFVQIPFGDPDAELAPLDGALDLFDAAAGSPRAALSDGGAHGEHVDWPRFAEGIALAAARVRERGYAPTFHHHMGSRVQAPAEIERLLELTDVGLLLDTGHLLAGGGDPVHGLRDWRERIDHVHVKDVRLDVLRRAGAWANAWRSRVFCELGAGDIDLDAFLAELVGGGYEGWLVVEQDRFPAPGEGPGDAAEAQVRNRRWLTEHTGL